MSMDDNEEFRRKIVEEGVSTILPEFLKFVENATPFELNVYHELVEKIKREVFDFELALKLRYDKIRGFMT